MITSKLVPSGLYQTEIGKVQRFDKLPCSSIFSSGREENQTLEYQVLSFTGTTLYFQMYSYKEGHKVKPNKWPQEASVILKYANKNESKVK